MHDLLTTQQMEELLMVDRTTIYRMAKRGDLPAMRVGNQWRFPREEIEAWMARRSGAVFTQGAGIGTAERAPDAVDPAHAGGVADSAEMFPLECIQMIQDTYADLLNATILVTDSTGQPVTRVSNPSGLVDEILQAPEGRGYYRRFWSEMGSDPTLQSRFAEDALGLNWARGLVREGKAIKALAIVGAIAPETWPPDPDSIQKASYEAGIPENRLHPHIEAVNQLGTQARRRLLPYVQRIGEILSHILEERMEFVARMQRIAELTHYGATTRRQRGRER